jgi:hypothetical protein
MAPKAASEVEGRVLAEPELTGTGTGSHGASARRASGRTGSPSPPSQPEALTASAGSGEPESNFNIIELDSGPNLNFTRIMYFATTSGFELCLNPPTRMHFASCGFELCLNLEPLNHCTPDLPGCILLVVDLNCVLEP